MPPSGDLSQLTQEIGNLQGTIVALKGTVERYIERAERAQTSQSIMCRDHGERLVRQEVKTRMLCGRIESVKEEIEDDVKAISRSQGIKGGLIGGSAGVVVFARELFVWIKGLVG